MLPVLLSNTSAVHVNTLAMCYMLHINGLISLFYSRLFVSALFEMAQCDTYHMPCVQHCIMMNLTVTGNCNASQCFLCSSGHQFIEDWWGVVSCEQTELEHCHQMAELQTLPIIVIYLKKHQILKQMQYFNVFSSIWHNTRDNKYDAKSVLSTLRKDHAFLCLHY